MNYDKQLTAKIFSIVIGLTMYLLYIFGNSTLDVWTYGIVNTILSLGIFGCFLWGFKITPEKSSKSFQYWFVLFPLVSIIILIGLIFSLEEFADIEKIDPFFKIGLWIAVLSSLGSVMVLIMSEKRLSQLEEEVFGNKKTRDNIKKKTDAQSED